VVTLLNLLIDETMRQIDEKTQRQIDLWGLKIEMK